MNTELDSPCRIPDQLQFAVKLHQQGKLDAALTTYLEILKVDPENADGNHLAGLALLARKNKGDLQLSLQYLEQAVRLDGTQSAFHNDLGNAFWNQGRIQEASESFSRAIQLDPDFVQPHFNLGNCLWLQGRFEQARLAYANTLAVNGEWAQARYMLAQCEYTLGNTETSMEIYRDVIRQRPNHIDAQLGLAHALLRAGQWLEGWRYFESRLSYPDLTFYAKSSIPQWDGSDMGQDNLLVFAEQGMGDAVQFARYLPLIRPRVGKLGLICDCSLHALLSSQPEIDELLDRSASSVHTRTADYHRRISLMSLPGLLHTTPDTSWQVPYINVDLTKYETWKRRLSNTDDSNVGLVWAGNPTQKDDKYRSCDLLELLPLFRIPGVRFFSLQVGQAREQIRALDRGTLEDLSIDLNDFSDTAAVIANLDLVISVDTAVAHLAGALGKPVWVMLWYSHCWRYLEERTDSPWYPTMRLFRQKRLNAWSEVVSDIAVELRNFDKIPPQLQI